MRWVFGLVATVAVIVGLGVLVVLATSSDETVVLDLDPGDCFDLAIDGDDTGIGIVRTVDCADPHEAEVVAAGLFDEDGTTQRSTDEVLFAEADARCAAALADRSELLERFGILPVVADEASWGPFDGKYVCVAVPYGGGTTTGSALAAAG